MISTAENLILVENAQAEGKIAKTWHSIVTRYSVQGSFLWAGNAGMQWEKAENQGDVSELYGLFSAHDPDFLCVIKINDL